MFYVVNKCTHCLLVENYTESVLYCDITVVEKLFEALDTNIFINLYYSCRIKIKIDGLKIKIKLIYFSISGHGFIFHYNRQ